MQSDLAQRLNVARIPGASDSEQGLLTRWHDYSIASISSMAFLDSHSSGEIFGSRPSC